MYKIALIGRDIAYTRSRQVHAAIAKAIEEEIEFRVVDVPYDEFPRAVTELLNGCDGFFVTKPYKVEIKRYVGGGDLRSGSVNVVRSADRAAFSTDGDGFIRALDRNFSGWRAKVNAVLVLGAGGAARSVVAALTALGKRVYVLDRTMMTAVRLVGAYAAAELYMNQPAEMIVNCTSVGLAGEDALAALCILPEFAYAFDLIYATENIPYGRTPFLRRNAERGALVADGTDMLIYQAIEGDRLILNGRFDVESVYERTVKIMRSGER